MLNLFFKKKKNIQISTKKSRKFMFIGCAISHVGCIRQNNEDNYVLGRYINGNMANYSHISMRSEDDLGTWKIAGVFDGMGGGEKGEIASYATAKLFSNMRNEIAAESDKSSIDTIFRESFLRANNQIVEMRKENGVCGTTGTVLCTNGQEFKIYHLGDSRAYLLRGFDFLQLTKDQTLAQLKRDTGLIAEDESESELDKNKLTNYIGRDLAGKYLNPIESQWIPLEDGDCILLCSDGLYNTCTSGEIKAVLTESKNIEERCEKLIEFALSREGSDNITCVVLLFANHIPD